ncbi:PIN/TRAM domain-containing protein [Anaerococcus vaginimassiliensis]|uniref:PIN/TRAM domain-containing protein n=1 Tax=Anaerococcus vaginimassiliensis TaxID=2042308 RepID=UPI00103153BC|nr:PIN domain-containing protein [Anaerococcus vaginimassiliensis]
MKRIIRLVLSIIGAVLGIVLLRLVNAGTEFLPKAGFLPILAHIAAALLGALVFYVLTDKLSGRFSAGFSLFEDNLKELPANKLIVGIVGAILGFLIAALVTRPLTQLTIPYVGNLIFVLLSILLYIGLGYLGWRVASNNADDILGIFVKKDNKEAKDKENKSFIFDRSKHTASPKILDTSVIIDGRILDIIETDFIEGELVVSEFVLEELQHIADSPDDLKRERGRRGLDIINKIKENDKIKLKITNKDYKDIKEVDSKLLKLAIDLNGKVFTNDYNLNKVADVQGIPILNINDLANALKPVVIPGEMMRIDVIKEGKGKNQGVGYLDDGTMVVVEDGVKYIDQTIDATVTSVLQTSAGRMIFVRHKND